MPPSGLHAQLTSFPNDSHWWPGLSRPSMIEVLLDRCIYHWWMLCIYSRLSLWPTIRTLLNNHTPRQHLLPHHMIICTWNPYNFLWSVLGPSWRVSLRQQKMSPSGLAFLKLPLSCSSLCLFIFPHLKNAFISCLEMRSSVVGTELPGWWNKVPLLFVFLR